MSESDSRRMDIPCHVKGPGFATVLALAKTTKG